MSPEPEPALAPLPPSLIASTLDVVLHVPDSERRQPHMFMKIAIALGAGPAEAAGVHFRLRAAESLLADARWQPWRYYFRTADHERHRAFDALVIALIATMPMTQDVRFTADAFFAALLTRVDASSDA